MKTLVHFISICIIFLVSESTFAQTAADYYLPLRVGNNLEFYRQGTEPGWDTRTTVYTIEGSDSISGQLYFREKGMEWPSNNSSNINVFHILWLRKDSVGNVFMYAVSNSLANIDSATVFNFNYFPNEFLSKGYSRSFNAGGYTETDSVLSVTATVSVPAGNFTNCLEISESHIDSAGNTIYQEYHYYAYGVGMVRNVRTIPANEVYTDDLTAYGITEVENKNNNNSIPMGFSLSQNYPNPFNPSTKINYTVSRSNMVTIIVYDILGNEAATLVNEDKPAGNYSVNFNANKLSSGVYFYRMQAGNFVETKQLILLK